MSPFAFPAFAFYWLTNNPEDPHWKFGSRHMLVVQFCFADAHFGKVPTTIHPYTLELLGMHNDGQVISDF